MSFRWQFVPLINRVFSAEAAKEALASGIDFIIQDASAMGELSPQGHMAEIIERRGESGLMEDCLHYKHPSVNDWFNAHLLQLISDTSGV
jgi:hypothetical protein